MRNHETSRKTTNENLWSLSPPAQSKIRGNPRKHTHTQKRKKTPKLKTKKEIQKKWKTHFAFPPSIIVNREKQLNLRNKITSRKYSVQTTLQQPRGIFISQLLFFFSTLVLLQPISRTLTFQGKNTKCRPRGSQQFKFAKCSIDACKQKGDKTTTEKFGPPPLLPLPIAPGDFRRFRSAERVWDPCIKGLG